MMLNHIWNCYSWLEQPSALWATVGHERDGGDAEAHMKREKEKEGQKREEKSRAKW